MIKKTFKSIFGILIGIVFLGNCFIASAHNVRLDVAYDPCSNLENTDGEDEAWYCLINVNENIEEIRHIADTTDTIRYYFKESSTLPNGERYCWTTDISEETAEEIKQAYVDSMMQWNNIIYYTYDEQYVLKANELIKVEKGSYENHNLIIIPTKDTNFIATTGPSLWVEDNKDPYYSVTINDAQNSGISHKHYSKWQITVNLDYFYVSQNMYENALPNLLDDTIKNVNLTRNRNGAHELAHVLGLFDVDECCSAQDKQDHHEEILMGYGAMLNRSPYATYKDIAGVAITRGLHTEIIIYGW